MNRQITGVEVTTPHPRQETCDGTSGFESGEERRAREGGRGAGGEGLMRAVGIQSGVGCGCQLGDGRQRGEGTTGRWTIYIALLLRCIGAAIPLCIRFYLVARHAPASAGHLTGQHTV